MSVRDMLVRFKSEGAIQFEGIATWPATVSKRRRRGSGPTDEEEEEAIANDDMKIRIPRSRPPPPSSQPLEEPARARPAPGHRPKTKRRESDREDEEGNLEGFVVDDDESGSSGDDSGSGSEQYEDDESDEEHVYLPSYNATSDRQVGATEGLLELPDTYTKRGGNLSAEESQKRRKENALKRKRQAEKAADKIKKETIERILNQDGAKKKREEKEAKKAKDSKTKRDKVTMMNCAHFKALSNKDHPAALIFSKGAPLPPVFARTLGPKA